MDNLVISLATNPATAMTKDGKVLGISRGTNTRLDFPAAGYVVKAVKDINDQTLFGLVNQWLDSLSTQEKDKIYDMYCRGKNIIIDTSRYEAANDRLISLFNGVSDILNIDRIATWVERLPGDPAAYKHTLAAYPEDEVSVDDYVEGEQEEIVHRPGTPVKTLLLHEVRDLIAVAIISKLMAPLLCEYTNKFRMVFQKMLEMQLFNIISHLNIFKHPIIERLYRYVRAFIMDPESREQLGVVIHSYMSEEEYADYVVALIICHRLMNAPLQPGHDKKTFVPNVISTAVRDACSNPAALFGEKRQRAKSDDQKGAADDDAKRSTFERISVGFTLSGGQQVMSNWGLQRFIARELSDCNTHKRLTRYDPRLIEYFLKQDRSDITNQNPQKILCSIVVDEFFPRTMFDLQTKADMDLLYVVSAIWLYQNGFEELAALQTARGGIDETYLCGTTIRQWSEADLETLTHLYPYRPAPAAGRPVMANLGMTLIDSLLKMFVTLRWSDGEGKGETVEPPNRFRSQMVEILKLRGT